MTYACARIGEYARRRPFVTGRASIPRGPASAAACPFSLFGRVLPPQKPRPADAQAPVQPHGRGKSQAMPAPTNVRELLELVKKSELIPHPRLEAFASTHTATAP